MAVETSRLRLLAVRTERWRRVCVIGADMVER